MNRKELLLKKERLQNKAKQEIDAWMESDKKEILYLLGISLDNVISYLKKSYKVYFNNISNYDVLACGESFEIEDMSFLIDANFEIRSYIEI